MATTTAAASNSGMVLSDYFTKQAEEKANKLYADSADQSRLDKDDFLNLLVTQLRYQDPMNPSDNQQMAAQMAQFSSLEQTQNMASSLEKMTTSLQDMVTTQGQSAISMSSSSAANLLGKTVRLRQSETTVPADGKTVDFKLTAAKNSELVILDSKDKVVRTLPLEGFTNQNKPILDSDGNGSMSWDGKTDLGTRAPVGSYKLVVRDSTTAAQSGSVWTDASIAGIEFDSEGPRLIAGGVSYRMSDLLAIAAPKATAPATTATTNPTTTGTNASNTSTSTSTASAADNSKGSTP
jgi:flagellar basal-body rod modification protein FlgD